MSDPQVFQFGSVVFPLADQAAGTSLLSVCDPALAKLIDFLAFEIDTKLSTALTGTLSSGALPVGKNIAMRLSVHPTEGHTKADLLKWPLFCMWRDTSKMSARTLNWRQDVHTLGWCYVLPPMTLQWADKFAHVLHAVVDIVNGALNYGFDPAYNSGERILGANNISSAQCTQAKYGPYKLGDQTDTIFHGIFGEIEVVEQQRPNNTGLSDFLGADVTVTHQSEDDVSTVVAANAIVGATSLQVTSSAGFAALDVVRIGKDTARDELVSVTAIPSATHLTLGAPGLAFAHTAVQADVVAREPITIVSAKTDVG